MYKIIFILIFMVSNSVLAETRSESIFLEGQTAEGLTCNLQISKDKDLHLFKLNFDHSVYRFVTFKKTNEFEGKFIENRYGVTRSVLVEPMFYLGVYTEIFIDVDFSVGLAVVKRRSLQSFKVGDDRFVDENFVCVFE